MTPIQSENVRTREEHKTKDNERNPTPPQHKGIKYALEVTNNTAAGSRKKYMQG